MWLSCDPEFKRQQPLQPHVFDYGFSQMSRRWLEASDNYAPGCPGEMNLADILRSSLMEEVEKKEEESECEVCPEFCLSHDPEEELEDKDCKELMVIIERCTTR